MEDTYFHALRLLQLPFAVAGKPSMSLVMCRVAGGATKRCRDALTDGSYTRTCTTVALTVGMTAGSFGNST